MPPTPYCDGLRRPEGTPPRRFSDYNRCQNRLALPCPGGALRRGALIKSYY